jgi:hypothetical protein
MQKNTQIINAPFTFEINELESSSLYREFFVVTKNSGEGVYISTDNDFELTNQCILVNPELFEAEIHYKFKNKPQSSKTLIDKRSWYES